MAAHSHIVMGTGMTETIQNWLINRLGIIVDVQSESFLRMVQNGYLIAKLLYSSDLISKEQLKIVQKTKDCEAAFNHVVIWLQNIDFIVDDKTRGDIADGKLCAATNLLYKLYLSLKDKNKLHFINRQVQQERLRPSNTRFAVTPIPEIGRDSPHVEVSSLSKPLRYYVHIIQWYKIRHAKLIAKRGKTIAEYKKHVVEHNQPKSTETVLTHSLEMDGSEHDEDYEVLLAQEKGAAKPERPDPKLAQRIISKLKNKRKLQRKQATTKVGMEVIIMEELWRKVSLKTKQQVDSAVSRKILKQSRFEKQIATRLIEVRDQKNSMAAGRRVVEDEIKQKNDELIMEDAFFKTKEVEEEERRYYFERERAIRLRDKINEEMLQLARKRKHDMCCRVVEDIADLAVYESEFFKKFGLVLCKDLTTGAGGIYQRLKTEMAAVFKASESIFDTAEDPLMLMIVKKLDDKSQKQMDSQNAINEQYLLDYYDYAPIFNENLDEIRLGANILGHIVFRLFLAKYPKAPSGFAPVLPKFDIAVCVDGISDSTATDVLSKLLDEKGVKIIHLDAAINSCLEAYKLEVKTPRHLEDLFANETIEALSKVNVRLEKGESVYEADDQISYPPFQEQEMQTPDVFPGGEPQLSPRAELGRLAYEILNLGEALNDNLLAKIFVDYLKSLEDVGGWVLVNYPQNFEQVAVLEEALTGSKPIQTKTKTEASSADLNLKLLEKGVSCTCLSGPETKHIEDIADLEFRDVPQNSPNDDQNARFRVSKLLACPDLAQPEINRSTYLTAYVRAKRSEDDQAATCFPPEESEIESYYRNQGVLRSFSYEVCDLSAMKRLAELILEGQSVPPKALHLEDQGLDKAKAVDGIQMGNEKIALEKSTNPSVASGKKKGGKEEKAKKGKGKSPKDGVKANKETQIPEVRYPVAKPDAWPGEDGWEYVDVSIPKKFQIALASLWESVESVYVNDMKHLFFQFRVLWNDFVPYLNSMRLYMNDFIVRPDDVQTYLHDFQTTFNKIDADLRNDDEVKAELHKRIYEFKMRMWDRCEERLRMAEDERRKIIGDDWITKQTCEVTDAYVTQLQIEIDRCADTMQLLNDYYVSMITKMPSEESVFEKTSTNYIEKNQTYSSFVNQLLTVGEVKVASPPFQKAFNDNFTLCAAAADAYQKKSLDILGRMEKYFQPKGKKPSQPTGKAKLKFTGPDEEVKQVGAKLITEWRSALTGEALRTLFRLNVVKSSMTNEVVQGILPYVGKIFADIKGDILERYKQELKGVQFTCDVFSRAVEEEAAVQPQLVLDGYEFHIRPDVLMFEDPLPEPERALREGENFSVRQLDQLVDLFLETAPHGVMCEREFMHLLQEMATRTLEDGTEPTNLNVTNRISSYYFGETEMVDWRDFVIYNLGVRFPTEAELMETRRQFRDCDVDSNEYVYDYQYYQVRFWFDGKTQRELLYKIYKTNEGTVNYTALLLAFCKDLNPVFGLAKALELALGRYVCWQEDEGEAFKNSMRDRRKEEERQQARFDSLDIIEHLMALVRPSDDSESPYTSDYIGRGAAAYFKELYSQEAEVLFKRPQVSFREKEAPRVLLEDLQEESRSDYTPPKIYFLSFEALLGVFMAAMPWHSIVQNMGDASLRQRLEIAYETCRNSEFDNLVFTHELLTSKLIVDLLEKICKFTVKYPC